jgi:hypothetical protein
METQLETVILEYASSCHFAAEPSQGGTATSTDKHADGQKLAVSKNATA